MPKQKYDFKQLKLEFFQSDIDEIKVFMETKYGQGKRNGTMNRNTRWRSKEKQEWKSKVLEQVLERRAKEEAKNLEIPVDKLMKAKKAVIWLFMQKVEKELQQKEPNVNVKEFDKILKIIKTELGEPTNISKTDATIKTEPIPESLLIKN